MRVYRILISVLKLFNAFGGGKTIRTIVFTLLFVVYELICLLWLYLLINALFAGEKSVNLPLLHSSLHFLQASFVLFGLYLVKFLLGFSLQKQLTNYFLTVNSSLTKALIKYHYSLPHISSKETTVADILNKVFTIGGYLSETVFQSVLFILSEGLITFILLVTLFMVDFKIMLLLLLCFVPVSYLLLRRSKRKLHAISENLIDEHSAYHQSLMTLFQGMTDIKLSGNFDHFYKQHNAKLKDLLALKKVSLIENTFPQKLLEFIAVGSLVALLISTELLGDSSGTLTLTAAYATAAFRLIPSINRWIGSFQKVQFYRSYLNYIEGLDLTLGYKEEKDHGAINLSSIELVNLSYHYHKKVFEHVNLKLESGKIYGLQGRSGVGKTTLANLLTGLLTPHDGVILINGKKTDPSLQIQLKHSSAFLTQDAYFLNGSLSENIAFGFDKPDKKKIIECVKKVFLLNWTERYESGIDTPVGENANRMSGGEKQRLLLARALYRDPSILVLDEPTTALDGETKTGIVNLLTSICQNTPLITLIISHDQEVLHYCDKIFRLENETLFEE